MRAKLGFTMELLATVLADQFKDAILLQALFMISPLVLNLLIFLCENVFTIITFVSFQTFLRLLIQTRIMNLMFSQLSLCIKKLITQFADERRNLFFVTVFLVFETPVIF